MTQQLHRYCYLLTWNKLQTFLSSAFPARNRHNRLGFPSKNQTPFLFHHRVPLADLPIQKPLLRLRHHLNRRSLKPRPAHPPPPLIHSLVSLHPQRPLTAHYVLYLLSEVKLLHLRSLSVIFRQHHIQRVEYGRIIVQ
ncbi:hypothetical protein V8G54_013871 [Vigna mungo]|uniref:Uncharacterized protein n=1 Tax=Vigna mungo TaxID=3915 RepID=A0AAQ3NGI0_VIGMU